MRGLTCVRYLLVSLLVATLCLGCKSTKSTTEDELRKKEQDYFNLYQTDVERQSLKGKVKSVVDTTYNVTIKFGEIVKTSVIECRAVSFDEKGRLLKDSRYDNRYNHIYDCNDDYKYVETDSTLIREIYSNEKLKNRSISLYDKDGKIVKTEIFNGKNKLAMLIAYTYNDRKLLQDYTAYGEDGNITIKRYDMQYDLNNCLIHYKLGRGETLKWGNATDIAYDANQHIISEKTYVYNSKETVLHQDNGNLEKSTEYIVDLETGNIIFVVNKKYGTYLGDVVVEKEEQLKYKYEGDWYEKEIAKYSHLTYNTKSTQKRELTYDEQGNYIKSVLYADEIPVEMAVRYIEYYK